MRVHLALSFVLTVAISGVLAVDAVHAGGCQRQRQPGDYLNCSLNGPYGPSGPNFIDCRAQCTALKNCLNNPPAGGCATQTAALNACAPGIHRPGIASTGSGLPTLAYKEGAGCFLTDGGSAAVAGLVMQGETTLVRTSDSLADEKCIVSSAEMVLGSDSTGFIGDVVAQRLGVDRSAVTMSADLYADLGASYDDVRGIGIELGKAFSVNVSEEATKHMNTVGDIVNCAQSAMMQ